MLIKTQELLNFLDIEKVDENIYRGNSYDIGQKHVFGGQVLFQSIQAMQDTVPQNRRLHSLHSYFILPGNLDIPIFFEVEKIRDGGSFSTRRVIAKQNDKSIFLISASFHIHEEGLNHQIPCPKVITPDKLLNEEQIVELFKDKLPERIQKIKLERPLEFKPIDILKFFKKENQEPTFQIWMKSKGDIVNNFETNQRLLAYASDYNLLITAVLPHLEDVSFDNLQMASLDHSMWFHREFNLNEWLLYATESTCANGARAFTRGNIFNLKGEIVASVTQEGLLRKKV